MPARPHPLLRKAASQSLASKYPRNRSPQNIHILSQALSRELKILRIKYLKYSNISCVTPRCCTLSQSNTINNIELLFMEFTSYLHPSNIPLSWTLKFAVDQY